MHHEPWVNAVDTVETQPSGAQRRQQAVRAPPSPSQDQTASPLSFPSSSGRTLAGATLQTPGLGSDHFLSLQSKHSSSAA